MNTYLPAPGRRSYSRIGVVVTAVLAAILVAAVAFLLLPKTQSEMLGAASGVSATGQCISSMPDNPKIVRACKFGNWWYSASRNPTTGNVGAIVVYDFHSATSLQNYVAANKTLLNEVVASTEPVEVLITFRSPVPVNQFRSWVQITGLNVLHSQLREAGRVTIGIEAQANDPLAQRDIDKFAHGSIQGVINTRATVAANQLAGLAGDPTVFLVDVSPTWVRRDLVAAGIAGGATARVEVDSPYWDMETLGLAKFALPPTP